MSDKDTKKELDILYSKINRILKENNATYEGHSMVHDIANLILEEKMKSILNIAKG